MNAQARIFPSRLLTPVVPCPGCGDRVQGLARATVAHPCGCVVDAAWAEAFSVEMGRRERGHKPQDVSTAVAARHVIRRREIAGRFDTLAYKRSAAAMAGLTARKAEVEREMCQLVTELVRIGGEVPAGHPHQGDVEPEVRQWAQQQDLLLPTGETVPRPPEPQVTLKRLTTAITGDAAFAGESATKVAATAKLIFQEIEAFATRGVPVSAITLRIVALLVPDAKAFLCARDATGPVVDTPPRDEDDSAEDTLARRRRRRLDVRNTQRRQDPEDA